MFYEFVQIDRAKEGYIGGSKFPEAVRPFRILDKTSFRQTSDCLLFWFEVLFSHIRQIRRGRKE